VSKRIKGKKHHPQRYLRFKGCFGSVYLTRPRLKFERLPEFLDVYDTDDFGTMMNSLNRVMYESDLILDFRRVKSITVTAALILKAFIDEYIVKHRKKIRLHGPRDPKTRTILNYLKIAHYPDVNRRHYKDIECWQMLDWEQGDTGEKMQFSKVLDTEIFPKCWPGRNILSKDSSTIASSLTEAFFNCQEHAYTGSKKDALFKKWYLGVGEYPQSKRFSFCIYDKGIGIKARLKENPVGWLDNLTDLIESDSKMIERATKGRSGSSSPQEGRGEGLKSAVELLESNGGQLDIFSDCGHFSTRAGQGGRDREYWLEGTLIAFTFPIDYNKG
jgi:hypothetical protein